MRRAWLTLIAVAALVGVACSKPGSIAVVEAAGRGEAVVVFSAWVVALARGDGRLVWQHELEMANKAKDGGLTYVHPVAGDDLVLVFADHGDTLEMLALSRATGERRWATTMADPFAATGAAMVGFGAAVDGPRVVVRLVPVGVREGTRSAPDVDLKAIDVALTADSGEELWQRRLSGTTSAPGPLAFTAPGRLLSYARTGIVEVDAATGKELRALPMTLVACMTADAVIGSNGERAVVAARHGTTPARVLDVAFAPARERCVERDGDIVLETGEGLARVDPATGSVRWRLDSDGDDLAWIVPVDLALPRFVVLPRTSATRGLDAEVWVVDLDEGRTLERHAVEGPVWSVVTRAHAYVVVRDRALVLALAPDTGKLARVTRMAGVNTRELAVRYDGLWYAQRSSDEPERAVRMFDLASGELRAAESSAITASDATAEGWAAAAPRAR